jgi:hypothetical protein
MDGKIAQAENGNPSSAKQSFAGKQPKEADMVLGWQDFVVIGIIVWALLDGRR